MAAPFNAPELVEKCAVFTELSKEEKAQLAQVGKIRKLEPEETLFTMDHQGKYFYIVASGKFRLDLNDYRSREYLPGELFGEVALFNRGQRLGTITALEPSSLLSFNRDHLLDENQLPTPVSLKVMMALTTNIVGYLQENKFLTSKELIERGENDRVEFKETFSKSNKEAITRSLVAFMNLKGGTIFIGVSDDGGIMGVNPDEKNIDEVRRDIRHYIKEKVGVSHSRQVNFDAEEINGKIIYRLDCPPSKRPVFFYEDKEKTRELFLVRIGPTNSQLKKKSEIVDYVLDRYAKDV